jgi:hypothetical protein
MKPSPRSRAFAWLVTLCVVSVIVLLVWFLPVVAALLLVSCVAFLAVGTGKTKGFWSGVKLFVMEVLFGW